MLFKGGVLLKRGFFEVLNPDDKNKINPSDEELIKLYEARDYQNFISKAVSYGKNIIIAGETGSGKTTFMKTLIDFISLDDRIITKEMLKKSNSMNTKISCNYSILAKQKVQIF